MGTVLAREKGQFGAVIVVLHPLRFGWRHRPVGSEGDLQWCGVGALVELGHLRCAAEYSPHRLALDLLLSFLL